MTLQSYKTIEGKKSTKAFFYTHLEELSSKPANFHSSHANHNVDITEHLPLNQGWATLLASRATLETSKITPGQHISMLTDFKVVLW